MTDRSITPVGIGEVEFQQLFKHNYRLLKNYLYYRSGNMKQAEDLIQDTFLKIWEIRATIDPEKVRALLFTIAGNLLKNEFKKQQLGIRLISQIAWQSDWESPEFLAEMKEFDQRLQAAINNLKEKQRVVFLMNRIDKLTYREIAVVLGITEKAVEKRMKLALEQLRKSIEHKI